MGKKDGDEDADDKKKNCLDDPRRSKGKRD